MKAGPFLEAPMGPGTSSLAEKANNPFGFIPVTFVLWAGGWSEEGKGFGAVVIQQGGNCQALFGMIYSPQSQCWRRLLCPATSLLRFGGQ